MKYFYKYTLKWSIHYLKTVENVIIQKKMKLYYAARFKVSMFSITVKKF